MFYEFIKTHREQLGLTQAKLSQLSGISLPTIQNIEGGRANPEMETIDHLVKALGIELQFSTKKADWDFLSVCGVPLLNLKSISEICSKEKFVSEMRLALLECGYSSDERKLKAMGATLLALKTHFPTVYGELSCAKIAPTLLKKSGTLKLRRIALDRLSRFL